MNEWSVPSARKARALGEDEVTAGGSLAIARHVLRGEDDTSFL